MATTYKTFLNNDIVSNRTLLHEAIPITGSILSGTYIGAAAAEENVKTYSHGMFSSVFDYPFLSSSSNHILDITLGIASDSALSRSSQGAGGHINTTDQRKKINIYNQMAQLLMGYDQTGSIEVFDEDGDILAGGTKMKEVFFINFSRLLSKDEIKKGSFTLDLAMSGTILGNADLSDDMIRIQDSNGENSFKINSPAGEYGLLFATEHPNALNADLLNVDNGTQKVGLLFYQAGIAVLTASMFMDTGSLGILKANASMTAGMNGVQYGTGSVTHNIQHELTGNLLQESANNFRKRINNLTFNNTTELNSTIYFCRAHHNEFNYSTNPTYLSSSKIVVKENTLENPVSYITSIGLYSADNELLAVAKLSEPIKKDPQTELTFRVRLDY